MGRDKRDWWEKEVGDVREVQGYHFQRGDYETSVEEEVNKLIGDCDNVEYMMGFD